MAKWRGQNRRWMAGAAKADSKWEGKLRDTVLKDTEYHPDKISYSVEHTYTPDFLIKKRNRALTENGSAKICNIYIEAKGRFRESSEASKYKWIRDSLPDGDKLVFLFHSPHKPMPHAKTRKDGTKQTHAEWAERNNFRWFDEDTIKELL